MDNLEDILAKMSKPEIPPLKHQDITGKAIIESKRKAVMSIWWLSLPVYLLATLTMKSLYKPGTTLKSNIRDLCTANHYLPLLLFFIVPAVLVVINIFQVRTIYKLTNSAKAGMINLLMIVLSSLILIFYLCN